MKVPANLKTALPLFLWLALFSVECSRGQVDNSGVFDNVLNRYSGGRVGMGRRHHDGRFLAVLDAGCDYRWSGRSA
jgi:hypothetical protein